MAKLQWMEFDVLEPYPHVVHRIFLRTLNVSQEAQNRELLRKNIGVSHLVFPNQTHGVNVERVTLKNIDKVPQADAIFTTEKDIGLAIAHADCQAAIFYDPVHEAIAAVHAGWRGLTQNIYARTIEAMRREIGTQPQNVLVGVAPSLGPDHSEFKNYKREFPQDLWRFQKQPNYFDLWEIARSQLSASGILEKNIEIIEICTHCNPEECFSYRRDKDTGRHGTVVALKSSAA
jgi:polyphenol oxidase